MTTYHLKNSAVQAVQYTGQNLDALPDFVKKFTAFSALSGTSQIGRNLVGALLVPHGGGYYTATNGDWLILTGKNMTVLSDKSFNEHYEADVVEPAPVVEAPAPVVAAPVAAAPVVTIPDPAPTAAVPAPAPAPTSAAPVVEPAPTAAAPAPVVTETTSDAAKS